MGSVTENVKEASQVLVSIVFLAVLRRSFSTEVERLQRSKDNSYVFRSYESGVLHFERTNERTDKGKEEILAVENRLRLKHGLQAMVGTIAVTQSHRVASRA